MNARPENPPVVQIRPPQLIQSLTTGFNIVANNIQLILLPIALDILLWFGPHLRLKTLVQPVINEAIQLLRETSTVDMRPMWDSLAKLWELFLNQFNLVSALSTFPIGIPALMASTSPLNTPFGAAQVVEMSSLIQTMLIWFGLSLAGLGLGTFYFAWVAQGCSQVLPRADCGDNPRARQFGGRIPPLRLSILAWQGIQVLAVILIFFIAGMIFLFPVILLATLLNILSPFLSQAVLILAFFSVVWFMVPLVFSVHGIFLCGQGVIHSMLTSSRVVRFSLPSTGMFLLMIIVLYQGMGVLWHVPSDNSWMALVGIFGHSFIATGLLAASFIYYRGGLAYVQSLRSFSLTGRGLK
jgi:hypothetical protein